MRVPILPPPGLVSDPGDFAAPGVWSSGSNVRFFHGAPQMIGGETTLQSGALETYGTVTKLMAYKVSGVVNVAVAGTGTLHRADTTTWARTDITPAADWVAGIGRSLAMFGDVLLAVPHSDATGPSASGTLFASTGGAQAVSVAAAPDNINVMLVTPSRQVMALGCNEEVSTTFNSRCIRWSDIEDYTDWTTLSSNNAGEYILPGQGDIVGARLLGDHIAIWTKGELFLGQYIGQPGQTFVFTRIDNTGLIARDCHAEFQGTVYWMAPDLFVYSWRPGSIVTKVECPCILDVWNEIGIDSGFPTAAMQIRFHAALIRKYGEIWFFYPTSADTPHPTKYLAYCVNESAAAQRQVWFRGSMNAAAVIDDPLLVDALNMHDSTAIRIDSAAPDKALTAIGMGYASATTWPSWSLQSSFYYIDEAHRRVQVQRYIADIDDDSSDFDLSLLVRNYPESAAVTKGPYTIETATSQTKADFRASGRLVAVKFDGGSTPGRFRLGKPVFEVVPLGNR